MSYKFFSDRPKDKDSIGTHEPIAKTIIELIRSNITKPFVIGLFGNWGVGKSSIVEMLQRLSGNEIKFVIIDAWRKDKENFIRHFIKKTARTLLNETDSEDVINDITFRKTTQIGSWTFDKKAKLYIVIYIVLLMLTLSVTIYDQINQINKDIPALLLGPFLISIITAVFVHLYLPLLKKDTTNTSEDITIEDPLHFRDIYFKKIIEKTNHSTICIIIDNIDRVTPEDALKIIKTLKTFIVDRDEDVKSDNEKVVFLVPCDDQELTKHLGKIENATEFLRKFFNVSLRIPPIIEQDLLHFTEDLIKNSGLPLNKLQQENVAFIINRVLQDSPRQPKQFLNKYISRFILAEEFESQGKLADGTITKIPEQLAFYMVLESEFYNVPEKVEDINNLIVNLDKEINRELSSFLSRTRSYWEKIDEDTWFALKHLKTPNDWQLPNFKKLLDAMVNRNIQDFIELAPNENNELSSKLDIIFKYLDNRPSMLNVVSTLLESLAIKPRHELVISDIMALKVLSIIDITNDDWLELPTNELYNVFLKDNKNKIKEIFEGIKLTDSNGVINVVSAKYWIGQPFLMKFCECILKDTEVYDNVVEDILSTVAPISTKFVDFGLDYSRLKSAPIVDAGIKLYATNDLFKPARIVSCLRELDNDYQGKYDGDLNTVLQNKIIESISKRTSISKIDEEVLLSYLNDCSKGEIISNDIKMNGLVDRLGQLLSIPGNSIVAAKSLLVMSRMEYCPQSKSKAIQTNRNLLSGILLQVNDIQAVKDFIVGEIQFLEEDVLTKVSLIDKEICFSILDKRPDLLIPILNTILRPQIEWASEWIKANTIESAETKSSVQEILLTFANQNDHPIEIYDILNFLDIENEASLKEIRAEHFSNLLSSSIYNINVPIQLQKIFEIMASCNYKPTKEQRTTLREANSKTDPETLPDPDYFRKLAKEVLKRK